MRNALAHFYDRLRATPRATAVRCGNRSHTFEVLDRRSNQLANYLVRNGMQPGEVLPILLNKHVETLVAMLAAWKLGSPYAPLDASAPQQRVAQMLQRCGARFCVAEARAKETLPEALEGVHCLYAEREGDLCGIDTERGDFEPRKLRDSDIAYVIFTSGTTGVPKGVAIHHGGLASFIAWCVSGFGVRPGCRVINLANFSFDQSVLDLAFMYGVGAELHLCEGRRDPMSLAAYIETHRIELISSVPTTFGLLLDPDFGLEPSQLLSIKWAFVGGAACPPQYVHRFHRMMPGARLVNMYGPTEVTVYCTAHTFSDIELSAGVDEVPLGSPEPNHHVQLWEDNAPVAGGRGELVVFGPQVMSAYWAEPDKTAAVIVEDPDTGMRGYRTGDIVRRNAQGQLVFVGRRDETIKSAGYRIDLGEFDAALTGVAGVSQAAAVAVPDSLLENAIHLFVARDAGSALAESDVLARCDAALPAYMQPHRVHFMDALPLSPAGKVDKRRLQAIAASNGDTGDAGPQPEPSR